MPDRVDSVSDTSDSVTEEEEELGVDGKSPGVFNIEEEIKRIEGQYYYSKSTASTDISDIKGIVYGGQSSRFWLYRKHMLCLDYQKLKFDTVKKAKDKRTKLPFYAW